MRKSFLLTACAVVFAVPLIALAAFSRPSDVLFGLENAGGPRSFEIKLYSTVGEEEDLVQFFVTGNGMTEGTTPQDLKISLHLNVSAVTTEGTISGVGDVIGYHEKVFFRLSNVKVSGPIITAGDLADIETMSREMRGRWFVAEAPQTTDSPSWDEMARELDLPFSAAQMREGIARVIDAVFAMEHSRFLAGTTYTLTLKPNFIVEGIRAAEGWLTEVNQDSAANMPETGDADLQEFEDLFRQNLTVRLKVDMSGDGAFRFARSYVTLSLPDEAVALSLEASMQQRPAPVYVQIPANATPVEELLGFSLIPEGLFDGGSDMPETIDDGAWPDLWPENEWNPCDMITDEVDLRDARLGDCPVTRESRRSLRERLQD
ncbi:MAG TPA: hypothetical protein DEB30_04140 [Candidatus Peribacter riflensis]|uniref:Uncharacterized protein n=1 Tax=Candidatus Peribacter riflensis TaxID=1735162 RepID=A0A0S1SFP7_9BACT|nr:MAG: hypothetical protein PeribacterA2_0774 [Candidatus Peribacter riflensis]ALM11242.1 MAG: hypothetical protein PeribacterB2_0776 [Candidatus Peribacter riflensis]ALM12344.1 MAG: hypothetical protein PeribacterC2_0775 [Candidatus Peribacter riflensis]ALM13446.1 MAG: hypothetical protein PeribacterD1_0775 [Candidatus Peribacter riflensis]ALM14545.1 MAG: hypothetical protein PeribacterD2_0773 [Candidatus Peribacter riflensis]